MEPMLPCTALYLLIRVTFSTPMGYHNSYRQALLTAIPITLCQPGLKSAARLRRDFPDVAAARAICRCRPIDISACIERDTSKWKAARIGRKIYQFRPSERPSLEDSAVTAGRRVLRAIQIPLRIERDCPVRPTSLIHSGPEPAG